MSDSTAEEKIEVTKEELKELIDERVEKRLKEETSDKRSSPDKGSVSRRDFLKKLGAGALGLGALSLPSVSAFDVKGDSFEVFTGTSSNNLTKYLSVPQGGPVEITNADLTVSNSSGSEAITLPVYTTESDLPNKPEGSIAYVSGTGSLYVEEGS